MVALKIGARDRIIVALDMDDIQTATHLADQLKDSIKIFKVGLQLFTAGGPAVVRALQERGCQIFLDLKYHDIPNTVAQAARLATKLGVFMFTVHTFGGSQMLRAAAEAAKESAIKRGVVKPLVLGVTILTSIDDNVLREELGINRTVKDQVLRLTGLARSAVLDGLVLSGCEVTAVRAKMGGEVVLVVPGVRPAWAGAQPADQRRIMEPAEAIRAGADYVVVGRPITGAANPVDAARRLVEELEEVSISS